MVSTFVKPGMVAYDIGANAGYYTLLLSQLVGPDGQVYAFEPFPTNVSNLLDHLAINRIKNVRVIECAVFESSGLRSFRSAPSNAMGSITSADEILRVPGLSLDDLVHRDGIRPPDFVKMDVEGSEGDVLRGAKSLLASTSAVWFIALHGMAPTLETEQILREHGYSIFDLSREEIRDLSMESKSEIYAVR